MTTPQPPPTCQYSSATVLFCSPSTWTAIFSETRIGRSITTMLFKESPRKFRNCETPQERHRVTHFGLDLKKDAILKVMGHGALQAVGEPGKREKSFCWVFNTTSMTTSMRKHPYVVHIIHPEIHSMRGGKEKDTGQYIGDFDHFSL